MDLGRVGAWWSGTWKVADQPELNTAAAMEALGYGTLWSSGGFDPGLSTRFGQLLDASRTVTVASGIVSIWASTPEEVGPAVAELEARHPGRFLLGLGTSHSAVVGDYTKPYSKMVAYLDGLDALEHPVPPERRVLAALAPRMLELAAARATGAHPYFVPVEHTALARGILGADSLLATEVAVVLETDPTKARGSPAPTPASTWGCPTTPRTYAASASATTTSTTAAATASSTPSSRGATSRRSPTGCSVTSRPAPITSASRSWPIGRTFPSTSTAPWRLRLPHSETSSAIFPAEEFAADAAASG